MSNRPYRGRRTRAQWLSLVERQARSGLSAKAFCERESLGYKSFIRWRAKGRAPGVAEGGDLIELTPPRSAPALSLPDDAASGDCVLELQVGGMVTVRIYTPS